MNFSDLERYNCINFCWASISKNQMESLPVSVLQLIGTYLNQNDKVSLMYTNYHFYSAIIPVLYKKLLITPLSLSKSKSTFRDSQFTVVGSLPTPLATDELNDNIFKSRQQVLLQSLEINTELSKMINEVVLYDNQTGRSIHEVFDNDLLKHLELHCPNIESFLVANALPHEVIMPSLKKVQLYHLSSIETLLNLNMNVEELRLLASNKPFDLSTLGKKAEDMFAHLKGLMFDDDLSQLETTKFLMDTTTRLSVEKLKIQHYHNGIEDKSVCISNAERLLNLVDLSKLKHLELEIGCDELVCSCYDSITLFLSQKDSLKLESLSIVQKTVQRDHNYSEKFDFNTTNLLEHLPNKSNLTKLSIRHEYPTDFNCVGGFEGNYLHRIELYKRTLPLLTGLRTLYAPTFMQSVSCYEQLMSDLLWNNTCGCKECQDYTSIFDDYVQKHQYFSDYNGRFVDMFPFFLFGTMGKTMAQSLITGCDSDMLRFPKLIKYWNFHDGDHQVIHMNQYDNNCGIDNTAFERLSVVVIHFLRDYVQEIKLLQSSVQNVILSGVFFSLSDNLIFE